MGLFSRKKESSAVIVQTARQENAFSFIGAKSPTSILERQLYDSLRETVPIIDAALSKLVRLVGGFDVICTNGAYQDSLNDFLENVQVGLTGRGIHHFIDSFLDGLLTYGNAVGEILVNNSSGEIAGLYNASPWNIDVRQGKSPVDTQYYSRGGGLDWMKVKYPQLILFCALNPPTSSPYGISVLRGLPSISNILMRIYECIGQNFDRVGNVRYAVTYKPSGDMDKAYAKDRAMQIAQEWSRGMSSTKDGQVRDFVSVGDVSIKVIGAENQLIDTDIPVRQLLEQIVAKLSIPPFLLGLNWSTTERMSKQQADILTSELEFYRRQLTPVIRQISNTYLSTMGIGGDVDVQWHNINLQDEVELANARLANAQAREIEARISDEN